MKERDGILLAVEGIDGAGKTTQVKLLANALNEAGQDVVISKEPTQGKWGQKIRESALRGRLPLKEEIELLTKDRKEHVADLIKPSLREGKVVILDRYFYSTIAYQGARGGDVKQLDQQMKGIAPLPNMVFLLDLDPRMALARISQFRGETPNHFEKADTLTQVREEFNRLWDVDEEIWKLDGDCSIEKLHRTILHLYVENALLEQRCAKSYGCDSFEHCGPRITGECDWYNISKRVSKTMPDDIALIQREEAQP